MADISIDELRRLARNFLIGKGGEAELEDTKRAMESDPQLGMEFLQQMQTALDDVAPAGFSPDQWKEIDARVATLINPLAKSGGLGFIGKFFGRLFKKKAPAEGGGRIKRKGAPEEARTKAVTESPTSLLTPEAVVAPASAEPSEGMEEMAPIAAAPAMAPVAPPALAGLASAVAEAKEPAAPRAKGAPKKWLMPLLLLVVALGLAYGAWLGLMAWQARKKTPAPAPVALPTPVPKPTPYSGPSRRVLPPSTQTEPLPSELPPMTPQPAGQVQPMGGLDAKDKDGNKGLPLP